MTGRVKRQQNWPMTGKYPNWHEMLHLKPKLSLKYPYSDSLFTATSLFSRPAEAVTVVTGTHSKHFAKWQWQIRLCWAVPIETVANFLGIHSVPERQRLHVGDVCHETHDFYRRTWPGDAHDSEHTRRQDSLLQRVLVQMYIQECQFKNSMVIFSCFLQANDRKTCMAIQLY